MPSPLESILDSVGSVFRGTFDAEKEKRKLYEEIAVIEQLQNMGRGWQHLSKWMQGRIEEYDSNIVSLSGNVKRNLPEIVSKTALRAAMTDILRAVNETIAERERKVRELAQLEEITGSAMGA
jgi:hypothetical protein